MVDSQNTASLYVRRYNKKHRPTTKTWEFNPKVLLCYAEPQIPTLFSFLPNKTNLYTHVPTYFLFSFLNPLQWPPDLQFNWKFTTKNLYDNHCLIHWPHSLTPATISNSFFCDSSQGTCGYLSTSQSGQKDLQFQFPSHPQKPQATGICPNWFIQST